MANIGFNEKLLTQMDALMKQLKQKKQKQNFQVWGNFMLITNLHWNSTKGMLTE